MPGVAPVMLQKPHKSILGRIMLIIGIIVLIFIILPIALVFILFYDGKTMTVNYDKNVTMNEFLDNYKNELLLQSIEDTSTSGSVEFALTQDDINSLIYYSYSMNESVNSNLRKHLPKAYINIDPTQAKYSLYAEGQFLFFKTRARLDAIVEVTDNPKGMSLTFTNAKIGRIGGLLGFANNFIKESTVQNFLGETGLSFEVNWKKKKITYTADGLLKDFNISSNNDSNIFYTFLNEIIQDDPSFVYIDPCRDKAINISFNLSSAHHELERNPFSYTNTIQAVRNEYLNKNGTIAENDIIQSFKQAAITNGEQPSNDNINIATYLENNNNGDITNPQTHITEEEFNRYLSGSQIVGTVYPFFNKVATSNHKINFVVINDFYADFKENNVVSFTMNISINGYETQMVFDTMVSDKISLNEDGKPNMEFTIMNATYGSISLIDNHGLKPVLQQMINDGFNVSGGENEIAIDGKKIAFNLDESVYHENYQISTENNRLVLDLHL